jgi:hypothetical protein
MDRTGPGAARKSSITDAVFGWSLDERIYEGIAGGQLCKTCYDRFGIQSMLLDLTKLSLSFIYIGLLLGPLFSLTRPTKSPGSYCMTFH